MDANKNYYKTNLIDELAASMRRNATLPALSDYQSATYTYHDVAVKIARLHLVFEETGIVKGDRIALCARNTAEWAIAFLATVTYGAVAVPILHEFRPETVEYLVNHSEARLLFSEKHITGSLDESRLPKVEGVILLPEFKPLSDGSEKFSKAISGIDEAFARRYPGGLQEKDINYDAIPSGDLMLINYTSGSTGSSKGVMLSEGNLWSNVRFGLANIDFLHAGDGMLSMLPLAHMYGLVFEFLFPFCRGCHITFLGKVPSPKVLLGAFAEIRPKLVITVPLVIEKIVKTKVFPSLRKMPVRLLIAIPGLRNIIYRKVREQLIGAFGGQLRQLILGGAAMNAEVENFLRRIRFPFTIGYGMTECAPLVTYEWWATQRPHSCGRLVDGMEARVQSPDPEHVPGILFVKGDNVMKGYFKNDVATDESLSADGWLNTGDICTIDADGYVYLRGRDKNMILGPSGQNIYPEEIEVVVNNMPLVAESLALDRDGKIVALVHPDYEAGRKQGLTKEQVNEQIQGLLMQINKQLPGYSRLSYIDIQPEEFEKTPKQSIRRFLYK